MRFFQGILTATLLCSLLSGCQKQSEDALVFEPVDSTFQRHGLWRVRTTSPANPQSVYVWEFRYDQEARVTDYLYYSIDSSRDPKGDTTLEGHIVYQYPGNEKKPYRSIAKVSIFGAGTTIYYRYDGQGRKILDSNALQDTKHQYYWDKVYYNYPSASRIVVNQDGKNPVIGNRKYADTMTLSVTGNISTIIHREEWEGKAPFFHLYTYTYDNKKNPFYDMTIRDTEFFNGEALNYLYSYIGKNPNNETERSVLYEKADAPSRKIFTHTYNSAGYPIKTVVKEYGSWGGLITDQLMEYDYAK